jgi:hypothetical protein
VSRTEVGNRPGGWLKLTKMCLGSPVFIEIKEVSNCANRKEMHRTCTQNQNYAINEQTDVYGLALILTEFSECSSGHCFFAIVVYHVTVNSLCCLPYCIRYFIVN